MREPTRLVLLAILLISAAAPSCNPTPQQRAVGASSTSPQGRRVLPGIDVLLTDSAHLIAGRRLGLITNQTGVDAAGGPSIDRLYAAGVPATDCPPPLSDCASRSRLLALFAPEHGIRGTARPGERVNDTVDMATGLPIYSLYGANRAPTREQLATLDIVLVDLQDVGARPFTYVSTMVLAMRAAAAAGKRIIVLDRPNPIGCTMQGPVLDTAYASFIGMLPVPLRHGMTMGELARFANAELRIGADLVVVPVKGWRCEWFDETGLPWVRPSPNLPDLEAVAWYPGTVLFEATNLSVGRGTDAPFRQVGAPWLRPRVVNDRLFFDGRPLADSVTFTPRNPGDGKYDGIPLRGVRFREARGTNVIQAALLLMISIRRANPDSTRIDTVGFFRRYGVRWDLRTLIHPREPADFEPQARRYFLYPRR